MDKKKMYQSVIFLIIGVVLFWLVYKDTNIDELYKESQKFKWFWLVASILFNLLSQALRAIRWKLLFAPIQYQPKTYNLLLSGVILVFTNLIIPRGGEISRLWVVNKYEKVPFSKLFGVALVERLTDFVILIILFLILLIWQFGLISDVLSLPQFNIRDISPERILMITGAAIALLAILWFVLKRIHFSNRIQQKIKQTKNDIYQGITSFSHLKNKFWYILVSLFVYVAWFLVVYVLLFAYPPTGHLTFKNAAFIYGLATLAFLLPIQAGMGAWHFVVIQCLLLFNIEPEQGKAFSLVAHAMANLIYLPLGAMAFALLPLVNQSGDKKK
jgi:glycosyltransferase 2 family protein